MKPKILFFVQLPPPIHGVSVVNKSIIDSDIINSRIEARYLDISPAKEISDLGRVSLRKIILTFGIFFSAIKAYFLFRPNTVYITLSPHGFAFWKDALLLVFVKLFGANVVIHIHGKGISEHVNKSRLLKFIYRVVFKGVNVIHLSECFFADVEAVFDARKKFFVVNNGVVGPNSINVQRDKTITFTYLSNFVPTKGADTFVSAINQLDLKYKNMFRVKMIGKISDQGFYDDLSRNLREDLKENVSFLGPLYGDEKSQALSKSDVFVLPTRNECFPLSVLEAMSFGLPILSTFEGAIPDIVDDGVNGCLFDGTDATELARKMAMYLDNPELVTLHGNNARVKFDERYRLEIFEKNFVEVILEASVR